MSTEGDNDPEERLRRELARLPRELVPPKGLEARVVAASAERGVFENHRTGARDLSRDRETLDKPKDDEKRGRQ